VFFRDQDMTPRQHRDFLANFGKVRIPPQRSTGIPIHPDEETVQVQEYNDYSKIGNDINWHSDNSFLEVPQKCSVLYAIDVPRSGGDTCWANMCAAYEGLSEPMRKMCDELTAVHDLAAKMGPGASALSGPETYTRIATMAPPVEHPVVRVNPDTGKRALYVNPLVTFRIKDVSDLESQTILNFLFEHCTQEEFVVRFRWEQGSVAFWDNRSSIHRGINDFFPQHRLMHRVAIDEESRPTAV